MGKKLLMSDLGTLYYDQHTDLHLSPVEKDYSDGFIDDFLVVAGLKSTNAVGLTKDEICIGQNGSIEHYAKNAINAISKLVNATDVFTFCAKLANFSRAVHIAADCSDPYWGVYRQNISELNGWLSMSDKRKLITVADRNEYAKYIMEKFSSGEIYNEFNMPQTQSSLGPLTDLLCGKCAKLGLYELFTKRIGNIFNVDSFMANTADRRYLLKALNHSSILVGSEGVPPIYAFDGLSCQWAGTVAVQQKAATQATSTSTAANTTANKVKTGSTTSNANAAGGAGAAWKNQGALSSKAIGLVSSTKSTVSSNTVYYIVYNNPNPSNSKEYRAFIRPLAGKYAVSNDTTKALIGNGSNYGDFVCFFATAAEANTFADALAANANVARTDLVITRVKADSNGYFTIKTDCGNVLARARGFNEALELTEGADIEKVEHASPDFKHMTDEEFDEYADTFYSFN